MDFNSIVNQILNESPDEVYMPDKKKARWNDNDAHVFGTLHALPGVEPFFMYGKNPATTHWNMIDDLVETLEKMKFKSFALNKRLLLAFNTLPDTAIPNSSKVVEDIFNSPQTLKLIKSNKLEEFFHNMTGSDEAVKREKIQLNLSIRTKIFKNAGRIWLEKKILSFWLTQEQIDNNAIENVFNYFKVPVQTRNEYFIDVINPAELDKEGTPDKHLPSYTEFKTGKGNKATKEQEKKTAELMAKQHGVAGAQKAKYDTGELPDVGAKKYMQQLPLHIRQRLQTSESKHIK